MPKEDAISAIKRECVHEFLDICDSNSLNVSYTEAINGKIGQMLAWQAETHFDF